MADEFIDDVVSPAELTGYVRDLVDGDLPFGFLFPPQRVDDIEFELTQANLVDAGQVAKYRSWDTAPPLGTRPGVEIIGGEIPPLGLSLRLNEKDIVRFERLRAGVADRFDERVRDVIWNDAETTARAVQNRLTHAHGDILETGVVVLTELGDVDSASAVRATFAVPGDHLNVTPAGADWDDTTNAVPITDLKTWEAEYRSNNGGRNPDGWAISSEVMADLVLNAQIRANLANVAGTVAAIVTETSVGAVIRAAGVNAPLVVMNDVERQAMDGSGTARVVGNRKVIGFKAGMGATLYGITPNAATLAGNGQLMFSDAPGIIAFQTRSVRPAAIMTTSEGVALPVLTDPAGLFVATV